MQWYVLGMGRLCVLAMVVLVSGCLSIPVNSNPQGATLILDNVDTGKTTPTELLVRNLRHGVHTVTVRKEGYRAVTPPQQIKIRVNAGAIVASALLPFPVGICQAIDPRSINSSNCESAPQVDARKEPLACPTDGQ